MARNRKLTELEKINKAQAQLRQAWRLIKSQQMRVHYVDAALAQIAVAAINLENHRRYILNATPADENEILSTGRQLERLAAAKVIPIGQGDGT